MSYNNYYKQLKSSYYDNFKSSISTKVQLQRTSLDERAQLSNLTQIEELALVRILKQPYTELDKPLKKELYDSIMLRLTGEETLSLSSRIWNFALSLIFSTGLTETVSDLEHRLLDEPKVPQITISDSTEKKLDAVFTMEFYHRMLLFLDNPLIEGSHKIAEVMLNDNSDRIDISNFLSTQ